MFLSLCCLLLIEATYGEYSSKISYYPIDESRAIAETNGGAIYVGLDEKAEKYFYDSTPQQGRTYSAIAFLREDTNMTGWAYLEVTNNVNLIIPGAKIPPVNDSVRAYTAGIAEGVLTRHLIELHYLNTEEGYCNKDKTYCQRLKKFIAENVEWMNKMVIAKRSSSSIWHHVGLYLEQVAGIADGFANEFFGPRSNSFKMETLYMMNIHGDIGDLETVLNMTKNLREPRGGCSGLVKITDDGDLLASHVTWATYQNMLRLIKKYDLVLNRRNGTSIAEETEGELAASFKMSSYPGYLMSYDDFYLSSNRLAIFETTFSNYNLTLWKFVQPTTLPSSIRSVIATRLARNGEEWAKILSRFNSGTYTNEWVVVDYNAWEKQKNSMKKKTGVLIVSDQLPGPVITRDYTSQLFKKSYFASYNIPAIPEAFYISNASALVKQWGPIYNYSNCPRALIFARNQSLIHDIVSAIALMRYNNFKEDPLSLCDGCNPPYSAELAISARNDLNKPDGKYPLHMLSYRSHGSLDVKIVNTDLARRLSFIAQGSPTFDQQPPYRWSTSGKTMIDTPHYGHPDLFDFYPVVYE